MCDATVNIDAILITEYVATAVQNNDGTECLRHTMIVCLLRACDIVL